MKTTLCHHHGCYSSAVTGKHFCKLHENEEQSWGKRPAPKRGKSGEWHSLYNSSRWRRISREFLSQNPACAVCGEPARIADHIIPHRGSEDLFYNPDNLQPLCWKHHSAKTLRENNFFKSRGDRGTKNN